MVVQSKPIPALYVVYVLRSTVSLSSLYIGSTPNPPRRLKQHNGTAKGGAVRTAKSHLRPWEMVAVISGFPSMVGALKFEWALTNSHLSLHIAPEDRITVSTQRKRSGMPKRPRLKMSAILSNVHLLLGVPSFSRWPLNLHFFDREVYSQWGKYCSLAGVAPLRKSVEVVTDFEPPATETVEATSRIDFLEDNFSSSEENALENSDREGKEVAGKQTEKPDWGIHALPLDYAPLAPYLEKGQEIITFEREGECVVCHQKLDHDKGLYAICSQAGCEGVGHLDCWSRHLLDQESKGEKHSTAIVPTSGRCPRCNGVVKWSDMMKEVTLRTRDQKEVDKLIKRRQKAAQAKAKKESKSPISPEKGKRGRKKKVAV